MYLVTDPIPPTAIAVAQVAKNKGSSIVTNAIAKNAECRAALENLRLQQKLPRSARLLGVSKVQPSTGRCSV